MFCNLHIRPGNGRGSGVKQLCSAVEDCLAAAGSCVDRDQWLTIRRATILASSARNQSNAAWSRLPRRRT